MNIPVYLCIRDDLRLRITTGEWGVGERLPSETELAAWYGVARMTVRQAVGALAAEGVLIRRQGLGTFTAAAASTPRNGYLQSYSEEVRGQGHEIQTSLIKAGTEQPPAPAREALQLGQFAVAIVIRRLRIVDGQPTLLQSSWLPYSRFAGLEAEPLVDGSLYAQLEVHYGTRVIRARQQVSAIGADQGAAAQLGLELRDPVLRIARTAYDTSSQAVEYGIGVMRPGLTVETVLERAPGPEPGRP
jgi:GntR family transcriptional regulator